MQRSKELDALELAYLLEQQALEEALEAGKLTEEDYNDRMTKLDEAYREERGDISREWRIKELQAEGDYKDDEKEINKLRTWALEWAEIKYLAELARIRTEAEEEKKKAQEQYAKDEKTAIDAANLEKIKADSAYWASKAALERQMMDTMEEQALAFARGEKTQWDAIYKGIGDAAAALYKFLVGGSVWTDMMDEMVASTEKGLDRITGDFQRLTPEIAATVTPTLGSMPKASTFAEPAPSVREVSIVQYIGEVSGDYDARRMADEAYRELMKKLANKY